MGGLRSAIISISTLFGSVFVRFGNKLLCSDQVSRGLLRVSGCGGAAPSQVDLSHRWNKNSAPIRAAPQATSTIVRATSRPLWISRVACTQLSRLDMYGRKNYCSFMTFVSLSSSKKDHRSNKGQALHPNSRHICYEFQRQHVRKLKPLTQPDPSRD